MSAWLTIQEAAKRVERTQRTIYRWQADGHLKILLGRVSEAQLLEADRLARKRRGRPRKGGTAMADEARGGSGTEEWFRGYDAGLKAGQEPGVLARYP